jgi:hypothetical protein
LVNFEFTPTVADLHFAYAAPNLADVPATAKRAFRSKKWQFASCTLDTIEKLPTVPDFLWVDLGKSPKLSRAATVLKHLADLQKSTAKDAFLFISGSALPAATHQALVERIYATLPNPADIVADLIGQPDLGAAVTKFLAQRKARLTGVEPAAMPARAAAPAVFVPNADLRSERGRLSIKPIAELFGMDAIEIGRLIGRDNKATLSKTPDADSLQALLQPFADIAMLRAPDFGDGQFRKWLNTPNEHMQNRAPIAWVREGRVGDVAGFVYGILTGQPG